MIYEQMLKLWQTNEKYQREIQSRCTFVTGDPIVGQKNPAIKFDDQNSLWLLGARVVVDNLQRSIEDPIYFLGSSGRRRMIDSSKKLYNELWSFERDRRVFGFLSIRLFTNW